MLECRALENVRVAEGISELDNRKLEAQPAVSWKTDIVAAFPAQGTSAACSEKRCRRLPTPRESGERTFGE